MSRLLAALIRWLRNWPDDQPDLPDGYENTEDSQERAEVYLLRKKEGLEE
jgi:hypothetical protein